jgi:hypothetical protein
MNAEMIDYYEVVQLIEGGFYYVYKNGVLLKDKNGTDRRFKTRNSARKRVARERAGDFHK